MNKNDMINMIDATVGPNDKVSDGKKAIDTMGQINNIGRASNTIKEKAKDLVLQYPVLFSETISFDTIAPVLRALEHEYSNLLSLVIQNASVEEIDKFGGRTSEYLKQFHRNVNESINYINERNISDASKELSSTIPLFESKSLNDYTLPVFLTEAKNSGNSSNVNEKNEKNTSTTATISNNEVKKLNDMSPTIIKGKMSWVGNGQNLERDIAFAVKAVPHTLKTSDIAYQLSNKVRNGSFLYKFIQWTTGEKKLFKDLIFHVDEMREKAIQTRNKNNYWWRKLEQLRDSAKSKKSYNLLKIGNRQLSNTEMSIPTVTLVITKQEADLIKSRENVDLLSNPTEVFTIINNFYLLSFLIVDETTDTCFIFNEMNKSFARYSINQLKTFGKDKKVDVEEILKKSLMR